MDKNSDPLAEELRCILSTRDLAVRSNDRAGFLSTQQGEIWGSQSQGYLATDKLSSELLWAAQDDVEDDLVVALVKERYWNRGRYSHQGYLLYTLLRQPDGNLRISNIVWGPPKSTGACP